MNLNLESSNENHFFFYMIMAVLGLFFAYKVFKFFNCIHKKLLRRQLKKSFNIQSLQNQPYQLQLQNDLKPDFSLTTRMGAIA